LIDDRVAELIRIHELELEIGYDFRGWQIRVRGYDPTGALHEDGFIEQGSLLEAMKSAIATFCVRYGISI
jgi:hypothetical protein